MLAWRKHHRWWASTLCALYCSCNTVGVAGFLYLGYLLGECVLVIDFYPFGVKKEKIIFTPYRAYSGQNHPPVFNNFLLWICSWAFIDSVIIPSISLKCSSSEVYFSLQSFWMDKQTRKQESNEFIQLDSNSVPLYDRGFALGLTSDDGTNNIEG